MTSWLNKQKKADLLDLANTAGANINKDLRKDELIDQLDGYLQKNQTRLQGQSAFENYYGTRRPSRPRESLGAAISDAEAEAKSVVRRSAKKATKVKADVENTAASFLASPGKVISDVASRISSPFARTPVARRVSSVNNTLATTGGEVAEEIERATTNLYAGAGDFYSVSGIPETIEWVRQTCSSVVGVQTSILLLEAYALQKAVLPWKFLFDLPGIPVLHPSTITVEVPDFFVLLRGSFWGPTVLWSLTSVFVPLIFAYFYNLTTQPVRRSSPRVQAQRYPYDPMIFSIAKAVITLLVYGAHAPYEYVDVYSARVVEHAMFGGYRGVITGSFISGIVAIWEATQR